MPASFGRHLTIGVEEELMLLDPQTLGLAPGVELVLGPPGLKTELFSCLVETNTRVCESADEVLEELVRLRALARGRADDVGLALAATGSHPFSPPEEQEIVPERRYLALLAERPAARRQLVCGLHVHVGMRSFAQCLETLEAVLPWLPAVLALSVNSPYLDGAEPGALSGRAGRLLELPRAGAPPVLDAATWETAAASVGGDYTKLLWDMRPHPRFGSLEVRIADQQTSVLRGAAFAALVQALCVAAPTPSAPLSRELYLQQRAAAARGVASTDELLALVEPAARDRGTWELVAGLRGPPEALRQLEVGEHGGPRAVAADVLARSSV